MSATQGNTTPGGLAPALVKKVFSIYLCLAVVLTLIQVALDYRDTYEQVVDELDAAAKAFEPGISNAVWDFQKDIANSIAQGMVDGRLINGVRIRDKAGQMHIEQTSGNAPMGFDVSRRFELFHVDRRGQKESIGEMVVFSNHGVVLARVQYGILVALMMSALKTAGLWLIIVTFANRLIARPLKELTGQVGAFDVVNAEQVPRVDLGNHKSVELCVLRDAFNDLGDRVVAHRRELADLAATLERRVQERTAELSEKNRALGAEVLVRKAAEQAVTRERDFSVALVRAIPEIFVLVDKAGVIMMSNPNAKRVFGLTDTGLDRLNDFVSQRDRDAVSSVLTKVFCDGEATCEADMSLQGNRPSPYYMIAHRVQLDDQACAIVVAVDISVRRAAEEQMRRLALYDTLTQLPNRAMLHDRLTQATAMAARQDHCMAVLFLDLDGFKAINDGAGHEVGDMVLREVGQRLQGVVRASDTVSRYGGDEFVVVLSCVANAQAAVPVAKKLIEVIRAPIICGDQTHSVGVSVGISVFPDHAADMVSLLERADAAMYRAKRRGKGCYEFADKLYGT